MARTSPRCSKCGKEHWNYVRCEEQAAKRHPDVIRQPRPDGLKEWGDHFDTIKRAGSSNVFWLEDSRVNRGTVTGPPGWTPPEAA